MSRVIRKVVLSVNREMMNFIIVNKKIYYSDRKFHALIRILPKPRNLIQVINGSRNRIPMFLVSLFKFTKEEIQQYENAKTDDELANIIIEDGRKNGTILVANGDMEITDEMYEAIQKVEVVS